MSCSYASMLMTARSPLPFLVMNTGSANVWQKWEISLYLLRRSALDLIVGIALSLIHIYPYARLRPGDQGTVVAVDDIGTVHIDWDNGSGLGAAYGADVIRRI